MRRLQCSPNSVRGAVKTTEYFRYRRLRPDRAWIHDAWIERVMRHPARREVQSDGRIRLWGAIAEAKGYHLRVILLPDGETVHNAFFDRDFRP